MKLFQDNPDAILPVNNKYNASSKDPDLARLLKRGFLKQERLGGGGRKSSGKRQSVLVLAKP